MLNSEAYRNLNTDSFRNTAGNNTIPNYSTATPQNTNKKRKQQSIL